MGSLHFYVQFCALIFLTNTSSYTFFMYFVFLFEADMYQSFVTEDSPECLASKLRHFAAVLSTMKIKRSEFISFCCHLYLRSISLMFQFQNGCIRKVMGYSLQVSLSILSLHY